MSDRHVIVWDLDGTIGEFGSLERSPDSGSPVRVATRSGIRQALDSLMNAGVVHTLLTMAGPEYAEAALRGTGLRDCFERVEGHGQRCKGDVQGIAEAFGIPSKQAPDRILFVGDRLDFDEPADNNVVFHFDPFSVRRSADPLQRLVVHLREAGGGSFREGFRSMAAPRSTWRTLWRRQPVPVGIPTTATIDGVDRLILLERSEACPVVAFEETPPDDHSRDEHRFIPRDVLGDVADGSNCGDKNAE